MERRQVLGRPVAQFKRFAIGRVELATEHAAREHRAHVLALVRIGVAETVVRPTQDGDDADRLDAQPRLLEYLADDRLRGGLAGVDATGRGTPQAAVPATLEQDVSALVVD